MRRAEPDPVHRALVARGYEFVPGAARLAEGQGGGYLRVDPVERARRERAGLAALPTAELLDALLNLPLGHRVRRVDVSAEDRERLGRAPAGVLAADHEGYLRLAVPPVEVGLVVVSARAWAEGLAAAAAFARLAPAVLATSREPWPEQLLEADLFGVGVWCPGRDGRLRELATVPTRPPARVTAARWAFQERAYETWLTARAVRQVSPEGGHHQP